MLESQPQVLYSLLVVRQLVGCLPHDVTCMSTTEAEYIAKVESFKKTVVTSLFGELSPSFSLESVHCENESAIHLARNHNTYHRQTKHIDIKYNFIRDEIESKRLTLVKIGTEDNPMTKSFIGLNTTHVLILLAPKIYGCLVFYYNRR